MQDPAILRCVRCGCSEDVSQFEQKLSTFQVSQPHPPAAAGKKPAKRAGGAAEDIVVCACSRCWSGYSQAGWQQLNTSFATWASKCATDRDFDQKAELSIRVAAGEMPKGWASEGVKMLERMAVSSVAGLSMIPEDSFMNVVNTKLTAKSSQNEAEAWYDCFGSKKTCVFAQRDGSTTGPAASAADQSSGVPGGAAQINIEVRYEQVFEREKIILAP